MREIKFRAWNKSYNFMMDVEKISLKTNRVYVYFDSEWWENFELMQFTGLHDKNGKEIWEGDIVKNRHGDICVIKYVNTGFYPMRNKDGTYSKVTNWDGIKNGEVIGNIHDNPELLEVTP